MRKCVTNNIKLFSLIILLLVSLTEVACSNRTNKSAKLKAQPEVQQPKVDQNFFSSKTLKDKIETARQSILTLTDFLPEKGNPYVHMANFGIEITKGPYFKAIASSQDLDKVVFLPGSKSLSMTAEDLTTDENSKSVYQFFLVYSATAEVLETYIQPTLAESILVGSLENSIGVEEAKIFRPTWQKIKDIATLYKDIFYSNESLKAKYEETKRKITLVICSKIAEEFERNIDFVEKGTDNQSLRLFITQVKTFASLSANVKDLIATKKSVAKVFDSKAKPMQAAEKALNSVPLPDSGDIDGADSSFEIVMRLDVGFDVLKGLAGRISQW